MKSRRCLKPKRYVWFVCFYLCLRTIGCGLMLRVRYLWRKPEKKAKVGVLGDWRKPERRVGGGQEMDERTRKREKKADVETELRKGKSMINEFDVDDDLATTWE